MKNFVIGEPFKTSKLTEFTLPDGYVMVWREHKFVEVVFISQDLDLPSSWKKDTVPWKILGDYQLIKKCFPGFHLPVGSKVIALEPGAVIQIDTSKKQLRFLGKRKKRVVIVDDSPTIRKLLKHIISGFPDWDIVMEVDSAELLPDAISEHFPDLVTLDFHLGKVNGSTAIKQYLAPRQIPTILITSQPKEDGNWVMDALEAGALDYLQKPESGNWEYMKEELRVKMEAGIRSKWQQAMNKEIPDKVLSTEFSPKDFLVVIGSSTGGTQAIQKILTKLPEKIPPILITQHIPPGFSRALAERLNKLCPFEVKEAEDGDEIRPGRVLIAPGNFHLRVSKSGTHVEVKDSEPVNRFRPSVEVLFKSVSENAKARTNVVAIMLTGMGKDGAAAMLELKNKGAYTMAQDEASCVVFGMPREAIKLGAVHEVVSLNDIPESLFSYLTKELAKKIS